MGYVNTKIGKLTNNTITLFDPIIIESEREDLEVFLSNFVRRDGLYRFRINPESVDVSKSKLTSAVLTQAGYERAYFGNELTRLAYRGNTGYLWLPQEFKGFHLQGSSFYDVRLSPVYQRFEQFKAWYESLNRDIMLLDHRGTLYKGMCVDFSYNESADEPFSIRYNFTFEAYTDKLYGEKLGLAIKRLSREDYLSADKIAATAFSAFRKALGDLRVVDEIPGGAGISRTVGLL